MEIRAPHNDSEWQEYFNLRYELLRKPWNQPLGSERNDGDKTAEHFALFWENEIVAIARLDTIDSETGQVRFVATSQTHQGKGFGKHLMNSVELKAKEMGLKKNILQARENAVDFYLSQDYSLVEKTHLLFGEIQHYLMEKEI